MLLVLFLYGNFLVFWQRGSRALIDSQQKTAFELRFILSGASGRRQVCF
jgi:hypothetical protein